MKNLLFIFIGLLLSSYFSQAQGELWGMTTSGGAEYQGVIFKANSDGTRQSVQYSFTTNYPGSYPSFGRMMQASNGKLYGVTISGGINDKGVLYEFDINTKSYTPKWFFDGLNSGANPTGSLIEYAAGKLYGMTTQGGSNNSGVLFEFDLTTNSYSKKIEFNGGTTGGSPYGELVMGSDGKLYGLSFNGGVNNQGILFEYDPITGLFAKKFDFDGINGGYPPGGLLSAIDGNLYGLTEFGGANNKGVLFQYDLSTNLYSKKIDFDGAGNGSQPAGSLIQLNDGVIYGMTSYGGTDDKGVLFSYDPSTGTIGKSFEFNAAAGYQPVSTLCLSNDGKIYGTAQYGGDHSLGVLFEFDPNITTYSRRVNFQYGKMGNIPSGGLVQSSNGNLYGTTSFGGASNMGVIFEFNPSANGYTRKVDFGFADNGSQPTGYLTTGPNGKMYGMTTRGGAHDFGIMFEYDTATKLLTKKIDFDSLTYGGLPLGNLTFFNNKLYGLTSLGGANNMGVLFEYDLASNLISGKADFDSNVGFDPEGDLTTAPNGKLYGFTRSGGVNNNGTIFEFNPLTKTIVKKFDFDLATSGAYPDGTLTITNGKFYGVAPFGGVNGMGTLFEYDPNSNSFTKKFDFDASANGNTFTRNLALHANGKLYGTTSIGGANNAGVLFEFDIQANSFSKKFDFNLNSTGQPRGLTFNPSDNKLYGMISAGGEVNTKGGLFSFDPASETFLKVFNFYGPNGAFPIGSLTLILGQTIQFPPISDKTFGDLSFSLFATASSGLEVSYTSSDPSVASVSGNTVTILKAGTVVITAHQEGDDNTLHADDVQQTLTIHKATLTATADDQTKIYGSANPNFTFSYSGFVGTDDASVIDTAPTISSAATQFSNAGTYSIDLTGGADNNYSFSMVDGTLTINQAALTVTADNQAKTYGANLNFTLSYSGFVGTDDATVIDTPPTIACTGTQFSDVGTYPITLSGGSDNNYTLTLVNGTLTVTKASLTATADDQTKPYGSLNPNFTISYAGFAGTDNADVLDTTPMLSCTATEISNVGTYPITLAGGSDGNYSITLVNGVLTITQTKQLIVFSPIADKTLGDMPFSLFATSSSGLLITYTSGSKVSMNRNQVTLVTAGRETITATQPGNTSYKAASSVSQSFCIKPEKPSIKKSTNDLPATLTSSASAGNQWYLNGSVINGETNNALTATLPGSYSVQVTIDDCISNFSDNAVLVITGDIKSNDPVSLYPNPSNDYLFIKGMMINGNELSVVDILGRYSTIHLEREQGLFKVDIRNLSAGVYILKVTGGNEIHVLKFVKQ